MSDGKRWPREEAVAVGSEIMDGLFGSVDKAVVAGSVRRHKPEVGDVEVVYIPSIAKTADPTDFFGKMVDYNVTDEAIEKMIRWGVLEKRLNVKGQETYGPKNKLMRHVKTGMPVDLFATSLSDWWVSLVIRTGSKETNLRLTTGAQAIGRKLNAYGAGVTILLTDQDVNGRHYYPGDVIPATSEEDVFRLCGVPFMKVEDR